MTGDETAKRVESLAEWFGAYEELDPELAECAIVDPDIGMTIKHPLVFSIFHQPVMNANVNKRLRDKQEALAAAWDEGDWRSYIWLHERPYRVDALVQIGDEIPDDQWWKAVGRVWIDSENIRELPDVWESILHSDRGDRWAIMTNEERTALAALPDTFDIWQGCTVERDDGWSWTTDRDKAYWFANRFAMLEHARGRVRQATVHKRHVVAYFTRRNESEILVAPDLVIPTRDV